MILTCLLFTVPKENNYNMVMTLLDRDHGRGIAGFPDGKFFDPHASANSNVVFHDEPHSNYPAEMYLGPASVVGRSYIADISKNSGDSISQTISLSASQEESHNLLDYMEEWTSEACSISTEHTGFNVATQDISQNEIIDEYFSNNNLSNLNKNNNNSTDHQLPPLNAFSRSLQTASTASSLPTLPEPQPQHFTVSPSPFSAASSPHNTTAMCVSQNANLWFSDTPSDSLSVGRTSPYNSPQKQVLGPHYFNATHASANPLQMNI